MPFVGDVHGVGDSHFTTELTLTNLTRGPLSATLVYTASLGSGSGQVTVSLAAGEQQIVPDTIAFLRSRGLAIPNDGSNVGGSLLAQPPSGTSPSLFLVGARTFTLASSGGTFGVYYPGLTLAQSAPSVAYITGLQQNSLQRSNLAVANRGDAFDSIILNVTFFDWTGTALGAPTAITLAPGQWTQLLTWVETGRLPRENCRLRAAASAPRWTTCYPSPRAEKAGAKRVHSRARMVPDRLQAVALTL